jgi:hypothetical protein
LFISQLELTYRPCFICFVSPHPLHCLSVCVSAQVWRLRASDPAPFHLPHPFPSLVSVSIFPLCVSLVHSHLLLSFLPPCVSAQVWRPTPRRIWRTPTTRGTSTWALPTTSGRATTRYVVWPVYLILLHNGAGNYCVCTVMMSGVHMWCIHMYWHSELPQQSRQQQRGKLQPASEKLCWADGDTYKHRVPTQVANSWASQHCVYSCRACLRYQRSLMLSRRDGACSVLLSPIHAIISMLSSLHIMHQPLIAFLPAAGGYGGYPPPGSYGGR